MRGITVYLVKKTKTGIDAINHPIYTETEVSVDNVLVAPVSSTEALETLNLTGKKAVYTLAIPKGDTNDWEGQKVRFFGRTWNVIQYSTEGIEHLIPLSWNKKVTVEING